MSPRQHSNGSIKLKTGMRKKVIIMGGVLAALYLCLSIIPYKMTMTISESVDHSVFVIKKGNIDFERGQYVAVKSPANPLSGDAYIKIVAGLPGDEVKVKGRDIYVAGVFRGRAKDVSLTGRNLEVIEGGVIPEGFIYIFAPHRDSHDSRYAEVGFVPISHVIGTARAIV